MQSSVKDVGERFVTVDAGSKKRQEKMDYYNGGPRRSLRKRSWTIMTRSRAKSQHVRNANDLEDMACSNHHVHARTGVFRRVLRLNVYSRPLINTQRLFEQATYLASVLPGQTRNLVQLQVFHDVSQQVSLIMILFEDAWRIESDGSNTRYMQ